jgi:SAM-dependent methyltransferase
VLDLGCGEPVVHFLVEHGITGVDTSPAMIALAR